MLCLGAVAAVLFRIGGLVVLLVVLLAVIGLRWGLGHPLPGWGTTVFLLAAVQAGYLVGAVSPLAGLLRKDPPPATKPDGDD